MVAISKITVNTLIFLFIFISMVGIVSSFFSVNKKITELQSQPKTKEVNEQLLIHKLTHVFETIFFVGAIATCLRLFGAI